MPDRDEKRDEDAENEQDERVTDLPDDQLEDVAGGVSPPGDGSTWG